ncbi:hypothetical protein IEQ34_011896 [Dendrobium chrysotoxum]|uniref:Uncharacterized protein n=1 Tax=Dendrobium chrysotoxum TaxID=161865 RepID=A0AAV7GSE6_DENCH|nr:hypothetical protein IEQ34_011896 [Dendrobium chrysotoxum]
MTNLSKTAEGIKDGTTYNRKGNEQINREQLRLLDDSPDRELHDPKNIGHVSLNLVDRESKHTGVTSEQITQNLILREPEPLKIGDLASNCVKSRDGNDGDGVLVELIVVEGGAGNDGGPGEEQPAKYRTRNADALVEICATEENGVDIESEKGGIADDGAEEGVRVGGKKGAEEFEAAVNVRSEGAREEERPANENLDEVGATGAECVEDLELVVDGADVWEGKRRAAAENCGDLGGSATPLEKSSGGSGVGSSGEVVGSRI